MSVEETRTTGSEQVAGNAWIFILPVFVASRLFYFFLGSLLVKFVPVDEAWQLQTSDVPFGTLNIWGHWDGDRYLSVAEGGYVESGFERGYSGGPPAFFPLYPLLIRSLAMLLGGPLDRGGLSVYGVLISLVTFCVGLYFVYRITEEGWGARVAQGTILTLSFFPTAFFFNAVYTESLFLALSAGAVWAARVRRDLLLACLLGVAATATRNVGLLLLVPLAFEWWHNRQEYGWRGAYMALIPGGLVAYMAHLWWRFGDPLLFYHAQRLAWGREPPGSFNPLAVALRLAYKNAQVLVDPANYEPFGFQKLIYVLSSINYLYNPVFLVLAIALIVVGWDIVPIGLKAYTIALLTVPILFAPPDNPLVSTPRFILVAFPLFIVLGTLLKDRRQLAGWLLVSAGASVIFTALFVGWFFVA